MSAQPLGEYFKDQEERRRSLHVLKANIHQGDPIFRENAGKQCTCNCLIFLIFAYTTHLQNVNARSLDNILKEGSSLYSKTSKMHGQEYIMVKSLRGHHYSRSNITRQQSSLNTQDCAFQMKNSKMQ